MYRFIPMRLQAIGIETPAPSYVTSSIMHRHQMPTPRARSTPCNQAHGERVEEVGMKGKNPDTARIDSRLIARDSPAEAPLRRPDAGPSHTIAAMSRLNIFSDSENRPMDEIYDDLVFRESSQPDEGRYIEVRTERNTISLRH